MRYAENDLKEEIRENILKDQEGFEEYLQDLIKGNLIENEIALGVSKAAVGKGVATLSLKQWAVLLREMQNHYSKCLLCPEDIPWCEMYHAVHFYEDNYCSYCRQVRTK